MVHNGGLRGFGIALYARTFFPDGAGTHPDEFNAALGLPEESLDEFTSVAIKMAGENYFENHVIPRITPTSS